VADVKPGARWVREHVEDEQFFSAIVELNLVSKGASRVRGVERAVRIPRVLPAGLDFCCKFCGVAERRQPFALLFVAVLHTDVTAYGCDSPTGESVDVLSQVTLLA